MVWGRVKPVGGGLTEKIRTLFSDWLKIFTRAPLNNLLIYYLWDIYVHWLYKFGTLEILMSSISEILQGSCKMVQGLLQSRKFLARKMTLQNI